MDDCAVKLDFYCPIWGSENLPFDTLCAKVVDAGYDGVELYYPLDDEATREEYLQSMERHGLKCIAQHWETIEPDVEKHIDEYRRRLEWIAEAKPLFINSQTGRDWFPMEDNQRIIEVAKQITAACGVKVVHETHRGKFLFSAATTRQFLEADPELRITADFSHWCNVSESLLEDQHESVSMAIERADHIHARIGHQQGPQVSDPRAPEWKEALDAHLVWWDAIVERHAERGSSLTITPEFGPFPYMPMLAYTQQPVADQWGINVYMANLLRERYGNESVKEKI
jgi:sugar phosphate isomerase/epimerase